ncbi:AAA family ATPase [candidate division WOR-3 bacterium]|nr:AAA family ATPase [candidate division WOR-3 bacterium]
MNDYLDDVVGQDTAKRFLRAAIKRDNLYNLLLAGPRGVGKRTMGFALARTLNCPLDSQNLHLITPIPSRIREKDEKIQEYSRRYLPDNPVIGSEDRVSILTDQIRNLEARLTHMPGANEKRVVLIIEADQMTDEAANRFLKTLEEPPIDTVFILTSSRVEHLLPTIRSRCRNVPFRYLNQAQIDKIVYSGTDDLLLGSAGEILSLRESGVIDKAMEVFEKTPLDLKSVAEVAGQYERKRVVDLYYPLMLLYRMVLYKKLDLVDRTDHDAEVTRKARRISVDLAVAAVTMLNDSIIRLERNPNKLLNLAYVLLRLP